MIYVVEIQYYDTADSTVKTAYYATEGFATKPSDTPANTVVAARIVNPALLRRDVFDVGTTGGASRVGYGELVLRNDDGVLDAFNTYAIDGRRLTVRYADSASAAYPSAYTTLFIGTMEQAEITLDTVSIRVRDRQVLATAALQPNKYAGDNVLPDGVEGLTSDLGGKPKVWLRGACFNVSPVMVNTSKLIYQVNDGEVRDLAAVYDSGALLSRDLAGNYADQAAMELTAPGEGEWRMWPEGGMFRLGSSAVGQLTCDVIEGLAPLDRSAAGIYRRTLMDAGVPYEQISGADLAALDAANRATLGLYVTEETTNQAVLDDIARSVGAWWGIDTDGIWRIKRLEAPSGTAVLELTADNIIDGSLRRVPLNDGGLPAFRVTVEGVPNYTVQTSGLAGYVSAPRRARLAQAHQDGIATDSSVQTSYLLAPEMTVSTKLACLGAAQTEATRLLALYSVKRDRFEVTVNADAATLAQIDLGVVVNITYTRFNLNAGKLFRVLGYQLDPTEGIASLTVWG